MTYLTGILVLSGIFFGIAFVASLVLGLLVSLFFGEDYDMEHDRDGRDKNGRKQELGKW